MKYRSGFVTNSSSSSYIRVSKVELTKELVDFFSEEYGKYGIRVLDKELINGENLKEDDNYEEFIDYCETNNIEIMDKNYYLMARFIAWTDDGDSNGEDAWLYEHIPNKFMEEIYEGAAD